LDSQFVVLSLGGNEWNKRLEAGPWIGLLRGLEAQGLPALLLGHGPEEEALAEAILAQTQWPLNLVGRVSLPDTAGLLHWSRGMVGNDSAAAHLASAMGCPTVAAFGPTRPDWSAPRGPHVRIVRREGLDCLACGLHGCPVPDHPCMRDLPAEALLAALQEVLRPTPQGRPISPVQPA
jgi:ADP-heptose:LPS heptosyltransferase